MKKVESPKALSKSGSVIGSPVAEAEIESEAERRVRERREMEEA